MVYVWNINERGMVLKSVINCVIVRGNKIFIYKVIGK